jgi:Tfp pilus assembly protein PilF
MRYESFSLRIEPGPDSSYVVSVRSPRGEGQGTFQLPRAALLAGGAASLDAGKDLFRALVKDEAAGLFYASLGSLRGPHQGLRINIAINPRCREEAPLQRLPWELLCRPETEDFLCLSRQTPVVRSLEAHRERRSAIARPRRLRILVVAASPAGCPALDVARELAHLEAAWKGQEKNVEIVFLRRGGVEEMRQALLAAPFHILHFMGHGELEEVSGQGILYFEQHDGTAQPFEGRHLAQLLHDFKSLRLVVLNACHTAESVGTLGPNPFAGAASALVMGGVPAVVAMSGPVSDAAAVAFSRTFYQRLAAGDPIEAAMTEGRLAIQSADPEDGAWAVPALFLRSADGMLFAPPSTVWARRAALLAGFALALSLLLFFASGWRREHRTAEATRLTNDGTGFLELGKEKKARESIRSALKSDPGNAAALGNLAVVEMQLGDDEAALQHARAAVRAAPEEAVHHYNLGNLLAFKKRYEEALPSLRRAIEIDPDYAYAYNELGNVYLELDRPAEARTALETGLSRDPTVSKLHKNLARVALAEGRPEEAIRQLEKALSLCSPADPAGRSEATYWLAAAQAAAGHAREVCAALRSFEVLDPLRLSPFAKKATLLAEQQRCAL